VCAGRAGRGGEWRERRGEKRGEGRWGACVFVGGGREQLCLWDPWNPDYGFALVLFSVFIAKTV